MPKAYKRICRRELLTCLIKRTLRFHSLRKRVGKSRAKRLQFATFFSFLPPRSENTPPGKAT